MRFSRVKGDLSFDKELYTRTAPFIAGLGAMITLAGLVAPDSVGLHDRGCLAWLATYTFVNVLYNLSLRWFNPPVWVDRTRILVSITGALVFFATVDPATNPIFWTILILPFLGQVPNARTRTESRFRFALYGVVVGASFAIHLPATGKLDWAILAGTRMGFIFGIAAWAYVARLHDQKQRVSLLAAYNKLAEKHKHLVQTQRFAALGEVSSAVAHEINNSLIGLIGGVEELDEYVHHSARKIDAPKNIDRMRRSLARITKVITQMRSFARDSTNDSPQLLDMKQLLEDATTLVRHQLSLRKISWDLVLPEQKIIVLGHSGELCQVIVNLINNARDALDEHSNAFKPKKILVSLHADAKNLVLEVKDTGPGIPVLVKDRIFDPFVTTKPLGRGTGLGLSICRDTIKRHEGTISFKTGSEGTIFTVELPLALASSAAAA